MENRKEATGSGEYDLTQGFPDQKGWLELTTKEEKIAFFLGGILYDEATGEGARVFTLRQARKHSQDELYAIQAGADLYSPAEELYVFLYNGSGSICVYQGIDLEVVPPC